MDTDRLRDVLATGDPEQRVWAGWELGLRSVGSDDLRRLAEGAPHPGTRRHLAVIVAGMGDHLVLRALAEHDPSPLVRADAITLLWRCTVDVATASTIEGFFESERSVEVCLCIVKLQPPLPAPVRTRILTRAVSSESVELRTAAATLLLEGEPRCPDALRQRLPIEKDAALADLIRMSWASSVEHRLLLEAAASWDPIAKRAALLALSRSNRLYPWSALVPFTSDPNLRPAVLALLTEPYTSDAQSWLLSQLSLDVPFEQRAPDYGVCWNAIRHLDAIRRGPKPPPLQLNERTRLEATEEEVREYDDGLDPESEDFDPWHDEAAMERAVLEVFGMDAGRADLFQDYD